MYDKVQSSYLRTCLRGLWVTLLRWCSYGERARSPTINYRFPPPPPPQPASQKVMHMFRFADIARVNTLRPHKYAYVFLKYALKCLLYASCYTFGCSPAPTLPWQGDDLFFLSACSDQKQKILLRWSLFWEGGRLKILVPPTKSQGPLCSLHHLKRKRLLMWVLKYFIYPINFYYWKCFIISLSFLFTSLSIILNTPSST